MVPFILLEPVCLDLLSESVCLDHRSKPTCLMPRPWLTPFILHLELNWLDLQCRRLS